MTGITRVEAINVSLVSIGGTVVTSEDNQSPDVLSINALLTSNTREVLQRGWWFNREYGITLSPDANGEVLVPQNTLSIDPESTGQDFVLRGQYLYDRVNHTRAIGTSVAVDLITLLEWQEIPVSAQTLIQYQTAQDFVGGNDGDADEYQKLEIKKNRALDELKREHLRNRDITVRSNRMVQRTMGRRTNRVTTRFGGGY